ncbi:MAG: hypothetical protein ACO219_04495, partial [Holophagaceae bacterium]
LAELKKKLPPAPSASASEKNRVRAVRPKTQADASVPVDEDRLFLAAMGLKPPPSETTKAAPVLQNLEEEDQLFLQSLAPARHPSGLSAKTPLQTEPFQNVLPPTIVPAESPAEPMAESIRLSESPQVEAPSLLSPTPEIHLAAGMNLEVDGHLDLRRFTDTDGLARLEERIEDGVFLGWHHLWVEFPSQGSLRTTVVENLKSGRYPSIRQYAVAPERMGGSHALILYYPPSF